MVAALLVGVGVALFCVVVVTFGACGGGGGMPWFDEAGVLLDEGLLCWGWFPHALPDFEFVAVPLASLP